MASIDWAKTTARREEKYLFWDSVQLILEIWRYIHLWWVITHAWHNINSGLAKLPLMLSHRGEIISAPKSIYRKTSCISHTKSQNLNVSHLVLQLSLPNPLKTGVKSSLMMYLEQRRQAMLQLHLSDQQFYCILRCDIYIRGFTVYIDGLVQERRNSNALAMELRLSCTNP